MDDIRPLRTEVDYDAALAKIERYFVNEPRPGTPEADRFDLLALVIGDYEDKHWPIDLPDPVSAIEFAIEQNRISRTDLVPILGSRARVSEILGRKRHLTLSMIWRLTRTLKIPAEALIQPYALKATRKAAASGGKLSSAKRDKKIASASTALVKTRRSKR